MIYPIVAYGDTVLRKKAADYAPEEVAEAIKIATDMFDTMDRASGVGLAAPQVGLAKRLFVIDSTLMLEEGDEEQGIREVFVNAQILEESGEPWAFEEGCLSIPGIRGNVMRKPNVKIRFIDGQGQERVEEYSGMTARVIQHEYDHIEGVLFTDHLSSLRKQMIKGKLDSISKGRVKHDYRMRFPK